MLKCVPTLHLVYLWPVLADTDSVQHLAGTVSEWEMPQSLIIFTVRHCIFYLRQELNPSLIDS